MPLLDLKRETSGRWPSILSALGIRDEFLRNKQGPCPACGGKDRYRFDDKDEGMHYCNHCGAGNGFSLLMKVRGVDFKEVARMVREVLPGAKEVKPKKKADPRERMNRIWKESGAPVAHVREYLSNRGLVIPEHDLREHPGLAYYEDGKVIGTYPAMVAMVRHASGKPATLHVTYLKDGKKAPVPSPRKVLSSLPAGAAIRLGNPNGIMAVAEGIETALAYDQRKDIPTWACVCEGGLRKFSPPIGIKRLVIAGDNDLSFTGQAAAYDLARRMKAAGLFEVEVDIPSAPGADWADMEVAK